jgi:hypothetical protein
MYVHLETTTLGLTWFQQSTKKIYFKLFTDWRSLSVCPYGMVLYVQNRNIGPCCLSSGAGFLGCLSGQIVLIQAGAWDTFFPGEAFDIITILSIFLQECLSISISANVASQILKEWVIKVGERCRVQISIWNSPGMCIAGQRCYRFQSQTLQDGTCR